MIKTKYFSKPLLALLILLSFGMSSFGFANNKPETVTKVECCEILESTEQSILDLQNNINDLRAQLPEAESEEAKAALEGRIAQLQSRLDQSRNDFVKYALGGVDVNFLTKNDDEADLNYDWQAELLQIVQPVFSEIQKLTQATREREDLNRELTLTNEKITKLKQGLAYLKAIPKENLDEKLVTRLAAIDDNWTNFLDNLKRDQAHYQTVLESLTTDKTFLQSLKDGVIDFVKGRGLVLFVSILTFAVTLYVLTKIMDFFVHRRNKNLHGQQKVNMRGRLLLLLYRALSGILALFASLVVLHAMGDMVLFGLAILILIALIFAFRNYVPKYFSEIRQFLNLGSARQGERVIYRGIPWIIERITLYSATLYNPALDNGRIRLMLPELKTLTSRPFETDEIWFPSKVGESFLLPNGTYVEVKRQTPESLYLDSFNSMIIYPTADFIANAPVNLSRGYYTVVDFGLSYDHFATPVDEVFTKLREYVTEFLSKTDIHDQYSSLSVEFRKINEGLSLVYTIIVAMKGSSAPYYYQSGRKIQEACLRCAQKEGWNMPFTAIEMRDHQNRAINSGQ
ncbi:hypothetical protein DC083_06805 [Ignatzschineria ureiclastica]|uniref:Mechanosensitive ion channel protein MscS n=1 Tax=Ignatzschineria ureiclastica TaxID=472582 RepID=A0A2U2ADT0_9GAMM|nr:hypothetical protein [Ignatzschineria ureiclastica]PWD80813.1 hypothetical protein DC083_06805 [Ignatzschineria ureiclastica]GGZ94531.1 hypothetical protein GCM10007162_07910 [Ignatzschineria ureiclastica]